jgi:protein-S-isoprenylcysteine O-methyltransferase Ste14
MAPRPAPTFSIIPPPVVYAVTFLLGWGLTWLGLPRPAWIGAQGVNWLGLVLIILGLFLAVASAGLFASRGTTLNPAGEPSRFVEDGAYRWTRNPMYVGLTTVYVGAALALGQAWTLALVVLPWSSTNWITIPFEEQRLRETFGQSYEQYCRRVRRWL